MLRKAQRRQRSERKISIKVLAISDSHHANQRVRAIVEKEKPDYILHLGDCVSDFNLLSREYPNILMQNVAGNCDNALDIPDSRLLTICGRRIFMTHGHIYQVKYTYLRAIYAACEVGAEILLFGHTHRAELFEENGITVMNPGAARDGSYGILELSEDGIHCRLENL